MRRRNNQPSHRVYRRVPNELSMGSIARLDDFRHGQPSAIAAMASALRRLRPPAAPDERNERAQSYRHRAEELRAVAQDVILRDTELTLRNLADSYDRMALRLEENDGSDLKS